MFGYRSSQLPIPCNCGLENIHQLWDEEETQKCSNLGVRNHDNFPPFAFIPDENDINLSFYQEDSSGVYQPSRHWCIIGKITIDEGLSFARPAVQITTFFGEKVRVFFHLEGGSNPTYFCWEDLKVGNTMCIMYPERHIFLDLQDGIRQESPDHVMVFPASLEAVAAAVENISEENGALSCFVCGESDKKPLSCGRCKVVFYCGKACQTHHWKTDHKALCNHASKLQKLAHLDWKCWKGTWENFDIQDDS